MFDAGGLSSTHGAHPKPNKPGSGEWISHLHPKKDSAGPASDGGSGVRPELQLLLQHSSLSAPYSFLQQQAVARRMEAIMGEAVKAENDAASPPTTGD